MIGGRKAAVIAVPQADMVMAMTISTIITAMTATETTITTRTTAIMIQEMVTSTMHSHGTVTTVMHLLLERIRSRIPLARDMRATPPQLVSQRQHSVMAHPHLASPVT